MKEPVRITRDWLQEHHACEDGKEWCLSHGELTLEELYPIFMQHQKYRWFSWLLVRVLTREQRIMLSIFAAELVLHVFERKHPDDSRPRLAIEAAKEYLKNPCEETRKAAHDAYTAAYDAYTAAYAGYAAAAAAYAAAAYAYDYADAYANSAAAYAYDYADAGDAGEAYEKVFEYGMSLLKEER